MSIFKNIERALFGDSERELERRRKVENRQSNQLRLIREHFGNRKDINIIINEIKRRGVGMIYGDNEDGNAHLSFPIFTYPVTGDITVDNRGGVYRYNSHGVLVFLDDFSYTAGVYYMKLKNGGELFGIDQRFLR